MQYGLSSTFKFKHLSRAENSASFPVRGIDLNFWYRCVVNLVCQLDCSVHKRTGPVLNVIFMVDTGKNLTIKIYKKFMTTLSLTGAPVSFITDETREALLGDNSQLDKETDPISLNAHGVSAQFYRSNFAGSQFKQVNILGTNFFLSGGLTLRLMNPSMF
jgi:hypothetical protein